MAHDLQQLSLLIRQEIVIQSRHLDLVEDHLTAARGSVERLQKYAELVDVRLAAEAAAPLAGPKVPELQHVLDEAGRNLVDAGRRLRLVRTDEQEEGA